MDEKQKKENLRFIPEGWYCEDLKQNKTCPYWRLIPGRPRYLNGWCDYIGKGDLEITLETKLVRSNGKVIKPKGSTSIPVGLLWDKCKEDGCPKSGD